VELGASPSVVGGFRSSLAPESFSTFAFGFWGEILPPKVLVAFSALDAALVSFDVFDATTLVAHREIKKNKCWNFTVSRIRETTCKFFSAAVS
jgi:hypothetical protein